MKYEILVSSSKKYLHVVVKEPVTAELLKDFIAETAKKSKEWLIDNFLFDLRYAPNRTGLAYHYEMVFIKSKELGFKYISKHALVVREEDRDDYSFVETILVNSGYKGKLFVDKKSAIEWIEKKTPAIHSS